MKKNLKLPVVLLALILAGVSMISCQKKLEPGKSIEQIRSEDGVPVRVATIGEKEFNKNLTFFARLSGIKETTQLSRIADKVVKINARVGSTVRDGQVIVEFPKDSPTLQYDQAKLGYDNAKKLYDRMSQLLKAGETSQQNFDNAETQYLVAKKNWESVLQFVHIESPISGTIVQMLVKEGDMVKHDVPIFTVAQLGKISAKVWVSSSEVQYVKSGMTATMRINGEEHQGKVAIVDLSMDEQHRAFGVEIHFDNRKGKIKSGITTDITINAYNNSDAIMLQRKTIVRDGDETYVYIAKDGKAERRDIRTGLENGIDIEIKEGLAPGDKIITEGISLLRDGIKIKIVD